MFNFDIELIKKLKLKDKSAFNEFYLKSVDIFFSYIKSRYNIDKNQAYDIISDFYVKLRDNIDNYNEQNKFSSYVWTMFTNLLKDYFKKSKELNFSDFGDSDWWNFFEESLESEDDVMKFLETDFNMEQIKRSLKRLPQDDQEIIFLKFIEELSYDEISSFLWIGLDSARKRLSRALSKLKRLLNN